MNLIKYSIIIALFCVCITAQAESTKIYHFEPQTKKWAPELVNNIDKIKDIYSAGKYAWALNGKNSVSFYDGSHWQNGQTIAGISRVFNFFPAFPISGKKPYAWLLGEDANKHIKISFFNGNTWSESNEVESSNMSVSAGHAFLLYEDHGEIRVKFTNVDHPKKWITTSALPINFKSTTISSFNDEKAFAFITGSDKVSASKHGALRIDANGNIKEIVSYNDLNSVLLGVSNNDVAIRIGHNYETDDSQSEFLYSHDNGETWTSIFASDYHWAAYRFIIHNGLFCESLSHKRNTHNLETTCFDTRSDNSKLHNVEFENQRSSSIHDFTIDSPSAWYMSSDLPYYSDYSGNTYPKLLQYNIKTDQIIDRKLETVAKNFEDDKSISDSEYLVCGHDFADKSATFYFDGTKWLTTSFSNADSRKYCRFSWSGQSRKNEGNLWLTLSDEQF